MQARLARTLRFEHRQVAYDNTAGHTAIRGDTFWRWPRCKESARTRRPTASPWHKAPLRSDTEGHEVKPHRDRGPEGVAGRAPANVAAWAPACCGPGAAVHWPAFSRLCPSSRPAWHWTLAFSKKRVGKDRGGTLTHVASRASCILAPKDADLTRARHQATHGILTEASESMGWRKGMEGHSLGRLSARSPRRRRAGQGGQGLRPHRSPTRSAVMPTTAHPRSADTQPHRSHVETITCQALADEDT